MRKRVYISGPISKGDLAHNITQAEKAFFVLLKAGIAPLCPHWSCYSTGHGPIDEHHWTGKRLVFSHATQNGGGGCGHADWLAADLAWVAVADAVLRLPGESRGADMEVACAQEHGKPVFESTDDVIEWAGGKQ